jgi:hypothetical protein
MCSPSVEIMPKMQLHDHIVQIQQAGGLNGRSMALLEIASGA